MKEKVLIDISHVSKRGSSLRITLPKKVVEKIAAKPGNIVGFYESSGMIFVETID